MLIFHIFILQVGCICGILGTAIIYETDAHVNRLHGNEGVMSMSIKAH
jgi:hypothetical protein